jgi:hypothetical protein
MCVAYASMWTLLPMLLLWPGLNYLYAALCLLLWPELCGSTMVWTMRLLMLASMIHLWATIRGKSFPVTNSLIRFVNSEFNEKNGRNCRSLA